MLRSVAGFQVMGRSPRRIDGVEKVTGGARYAGDIRLPGMLYARLVRPPAHGAGLARLDTSEAEAMAGVSVVRQDDMVAVLAADPEAAAAGLHRIETDWQPASSQLDPETIFDHLVEKAPPSQVMVEQGDPATVGSRVGHLFETTYRKGYVAHAPMEPHTATASWEDGKLTVWASTQTPFPTRDHIARQLGLTSRDVRVITPFVGGGFGGKSAGRQALEAARLARATGRPVQVAWTRAEEFFFDTFDPAAVVKITSAMDGDGRLTLWDYEVYGAGDRATELFYRVPNARVRVHGGWHGEGSEVHPFAVGPWRAPGANMNVFARESQIDLMAAAAGRDPLDFRLRNTRDTRMRRVLRAAAEAFGWQAAPGPSGQGRAVACAADAGSYVALIAQVRVDRDQGSVQVDRVVCAQDMGVVVNPEGATMQVEGCITMGLGYVFAEELRFRGGEILDRNFGTYQLPRFSWVPKIETVLVKNEELAPQGGGEPAIVSMGAVMANAVFDATGARLLRLPLTPERVRDALRGVRPVGEPATVGAT
jgi:nicotinate dehydrogenase subunit B